MTYKLITNPTLARVGFCFLWVKSHRTKYQAFLRRIRNLVLSDGRLAVWRTCRAIDFDGWVWHFFSSDDESIAICCEDHKSKMPVRRQLVKCVEHQRSLLHLAVVIEQFLCLASGIANLAYFIDGGINTHRHPCHCP